MCDAQDATSIGDSVRQFASGHREFSAELTRRLCTAFGVDPAGVRELTLSIGVDRLPALTVNTHGGFRAVSWDYSKAADVLFGPSREGD